MKLFKPFLLVLLFSVSAAGQSNYKFKHYTINDGLVESMVISTIQDSRGFIWFASNGLSRFDGYKFKNYVNHADDSTSLVNNMVQALFEDSKGRIWVGTRAGVSVYHRETDNFTTVFPDSLNNRLNISCFFEDDEGLIYIGTYGLGIIRYDTQKKTKQIFTYIEGDSKSICSSWISKIIESKQKEIWVATFHGLNYFDRKTGTFTRYKRTDYKKPDWVKDAITSIAFDKKGYLWIGSRFGVARFSRQTGEFKDYITQSSSKGEFASIEVKTIRFVKENELWAGTQNGIIILNTESGKTEIIEHRDNDLESLGGNEVEEIYLDKANNLWIGTRASGVDKLKFLTERFYLYKNSYPAFKNLSSNEIYGIAEDKDRKIWLTTLNGLNKFDPEKETFQNFMKKNNPGITSDYQWAVYTNRKAESDLLWIGTEEGLFAFSISQNRVVNPFANKSLLDSLKSERIMAITGDSENLWLGTVTGLINLNLKSEKIKKYVHSNADKNSISNSYVWRLFVDSKNDLWIGTTNGLNYLKHGSSGFVVYKNKKNDEFSLRNNEVCEIFEDKGGIFWIGTSDGLNKFDTKTGKFYKIELPVQSETIYAIQKDKAGFLWLGSGKGLIKYNPVNGSSIIYDVEDGIQSNEFNFPSLVSSTGEFYFAGVNGFNIFYPEEIRLNKYIPPVYITSFSVMNKQLRVGDLFNGRVVLKQSIELTKEIDLNYDENIVSLEFASLDFLSPNKNHYQYIMENYESSWNQAGNMRYVTYKLEPGTYIFKVKGTNSDRIWNEKPAELIIIIHPPWWNTVWFKIFAALVLTSLIYFFLKQRTKNLVKQKANLERQVSDRTSELEKQQEIVRNQAERILQTNLELEQLNGELEKRVIERTAELEHAKIKAEKADEIKSEFLAQMSHEIRSPINVVLSFSNLIRSEVEDKLDSDLREGFKSISNAGKRIIRTVDLLLNMAEIQTETFEYIAAPIDLNKDILDSVLPEYHFSAIEKSISLLQENLAVNPQLIGDHYTLEQIFANLIDNAIKYTNSGGVVIKTYNNTAGELVCEIKDTGIGMSEEFMSRLFVPFSQEEQGYTRKYEGNGLGLALVKKYCDLNNIDLSVASLKGEGATFTLRFLNTILLNSNK